MIRLDGNALEAIIEALTARLAGEIELEEGPQWSDYEKALEWALGEADRRSARRRARKRRSMTE